MYSVVENEQPCVYRVLSYTSCGPNNPLLDVTGLKVIDRASGRGGAAGVLAKELGVGGWTYI